MSRFTEVASMEHDDDKTEGSHPLECAVRDEDGMFSFMIDGDQALELIVLPETAYDFAKSVMEAAEVILEGSREP